MSFSRIHSAVCIGLEAIAVEVEVDLRPADHLSLIIVGLPDAAVRESKERVIAAIRNSGFELKEVQAIVNLAPSDLKKEGSLFDLPIALAILQAAKMIPRPSSPYMAVGELSLSGKTKAIAGALAMALYAQQMQLSLILPQENLAEAKLAFELKAIPLSHLKEASALKQREMKIPSQPPSLLSTKVDVDFQEIKGQAHVKRALEIAAAGNHHLLLTGPPGTGKTMMAKAFASILPPLTFQEALEITKIYSIAGKLKEEGLMTMRPMRAPHHTISYAGLIGGGAVPKPGEVTLAHGGVLFLDELPEFSKQALEALRQPLEDRCVTISRAKAHLTYPCRFLLIAAMNPCPCGYLGHPKKACRCSSVQIDRYRHKISGPLLDRIDLAVEVPSPSYQQLVDPEKGPSSQEMQARTKACRLRQHQRYGRVQANGELSAKELQQHAALDAKGSCLMEQAVKTLSLSARAYSRLLKVARTIADLEESPSILEEHLMEALTYRQLW